MLEVIEQPNHFKRLYDLELPLEQKNRKIVKDIYGGSKVTFSSKAQKQLKQFKENGWDNYPVCMAKTQYSFSDDATQLGAPENFEITIRELEAKTGAGFIVALTDAIMTMPGLPKTCSVKYGCNTRWSCYWIILKPNLSITIMLKLKKHLHRTCERMCFEGVNFRITKLFKYR